MPRKHPSKKSVSEKAKPKKTPMLGVLGFAFAVVLVGGGSWWAFAQSDPVNAAPGELVVYKSASCGCCGNWVDYMRDSGFSVTVNNTSDVDAVKEKYGVPYDMGSCHTAIIDGHVIEGHVPANDVKRFLAEKSNALGLAAPGMPVGSPGMEQGGHREPYDVIAFGPEGSKIYAKH